MSLTGTSKPTPPAPFPRQGMGAILREILRFLEKRRLVALVSSMVSPETRALMLKPPWPLSWLSAKPVEEIETAVFSLLGRTGALELGLELGRTVGGTLVQPLLKTALQLFGSSPATVFGHLDRFFSVSTRGMSFNFRSIDNLTGVVDMSFTGPDVPVATLHVLQGTLQYVFEVTGCEGDVGDPEIVLRTALGTSVAYQIRLRP